MAGKNVDMFKLVEQVEKQKSMDIDDIFSTLDSVKAEKKRSRPIPIPMLPILP